MGSRCGRPAAMDKRVPANEEHLRQVRSKLGMVFQHFNLFPAYDGVGEHHRCAPTRQRRNQRSVQQAGE